MISDLDCISTSNKVIEKKTLISTKLKKTFNKKLISLDEKNDLIILNSNFEICTNEDGDVKNRVLIFFILINKGLMFIDQQI